MLKHIFPVGDSREHYEHIDCPCRPTLVEGDRYDACIHRAFDGRDIILQAEIIMGIRCKEHGHYINEKGDHCDPPPLFYE